MSDLNLLKYLRECRNKSIDVKSIVRLEKMIPYLVVYIDYITWPNIVKDRNDE
jgi:hypothetical protein